MKRRYLIALVVLILCAGLATTVSADQQKAVSAAERIVAKWDALFQRGAKFVFPVKGAWGVRSWVATSPVKYDIQRTQSLVSPYILTIAVDAQLFQGIGYPTPQAAFRATGLQPFPPRRPRAYPILITYAFQKDSWVLTGGNKTFQGNHFKALKRPENRSVYQGLERVSIGRRKK